MSIWNNMWRLLTVDDTVVNEQFSLDADASSGGHPADAKEQTGQEGHRSPSSPHVEETSDRAAERQELGDTMPLFVMASIDENKKTIEEAFHLPTNKDIVVRQFQIASHSPTKAMVVFVDGLSDKTIINSHILEPLMVLRPINPVMDSSSDKSAFIKEALLPGNQVDEYMLWKDVIHNILTGSTALFVEGTPHALLVETKGWEHRMVSTTQTESVVRGPHDAFTESFRANTGLVRARLRSSDLVTEMMSLGRGAKTDVAIMYIEGLANPKLIEEVKRRIKAIDISYIGDSGLLEQFIEDDPVGVLPRLLSTERPDRVARFLSEGHVSILIGQSPYALIAPISCWALLHTAEDAYLRWPYGSMLRTIRMISLFVSIFLPSLYIAVSNYHPEMIPTGLMIAIAASRETVPFPVVVEVIMMEMSIELIREAGIRIPSAIGPTIGIVGALILGQAAVQAGIVSPILIIVVAVTALASFTMPNYNLSLAVRILRFAFLVLGAMLGFYGIMLGAMVLLMHVATLRSFGVPMMTPITPYKPSAPDVILRGQVDQMRKQSPTAHPTDHQRQVGITRPWSPWTKDSREAKRARSSHPAEDKKED